MGHVVEGTVHATGGGVYSIRLDDGRTVDASLRGRLKQERGVVVVGDRVVVAEADAGWTLERVRERETALVRRGRHGRGPKVLAANLDRVLVVVALREPRATPELIDRLLVLVEASGIHPILVLNKLDLPGASAASEELGELYESIGYRVLSVSALSRDGLTDLAATMAEGTSALIGPSGVGKSSLLNAIDPDLELRTGTLSAKTGTGRHTTVSSRLLELDGGGFVADTPGFGDVALWGVATDEVADCFPEFRQWVGECRFRSCAHVHEPECGVRAAVAAGEVPESRYRSYLTLREEAER